MNLKIKLKPKSMRRKKTILFIGSACFSAFSLQAQQSIRGSGSY